MDKIAKYMLIVIQSHHSTHNLLTNDQDTWEGLLNIIICREFDVILMFEMKNVYNIFLFVPMQWLTFANHHNIYTCLASLAAPVWVRMTCVLPDCLSSESKCIFPFVVLVQVGAVPHASPRAACHHHGWCAPLRSTWRIEEASRS